LLLIDQLEDLDDLPIGEVGPNLGELVLVDLGESMLPTVRSCCSASWAKRSRADLT